MQIVPDEDLIAICREIMSADWTESEWAQRESSDIFQQGTYCGGFDADEMEFCFETQIGGTEYWFQFDLQDATGIAKGHAIALEAVKTNT